MRGSRRIECWFLLALLVAVALTPGHAVAQAAARENHTVTIEFIAHACFRVTSPAGKQVLIDPYASLPRDGCPAWVVRFANRDRRRLARSTLLPSGAAVLIMAVRVSSSPTLSRPFVELFWKMLDFSTKWPTKFAGKVSKCRHNENCWVRSGIG